MILYLHGPDTFRSRQRLKYYKEGFMKKYDPSGLNVATLNGSSLSMEEFRKALGTSGFLSKKRLVVIENLMLQNKDKKIQQSIVEYLRDEWNDENVLIFWEEEGEERSKRKGRASSANPLRAFLTKQKEENFPLLTETELQKWIRDEVRKREGMIESAAVLELTSLVGPDLWQMDQEIEKLVHYAIGQPRQKRRPIIADDVRVLVRARFDENIFHLTDALAEKDASRSLKLINDQLEAGSHELYILTMLVRQFRILLQVKEILDQEQNTYAIASTLRLHPFVAQKAIRDAQRFSLAELKSMYAMLLDVDLKIKTTQDNPETLFDLFVLKVCGVR